MNFDAILHTIKQRIERLRGIGLQARVRVCGGNLRARPGVVLRNAAVIELGSSVHLYDGSMLDAGNLTQAESRIILGDRAMIREYAIVRSQAGRVVVGEDSFVGPNCVLQGPALEIGSHVMIAAGCCIFSSNHDHSGGEGAMKDAAEISIGITVCDDVWIGANASILDDVTVGRGAVVGAGSVVTRDVLPGTIVVGNPARPIGDRKS